MNHAGCAVQVLIPPVFYLIMDVTGTSYIALSLVALIIIAALVFFSGRGMKRGRITPLEGIAFAFVIAGIVFGDERLIGYSLIGIGVALAVADALLTRKK